MLKLESPFHLSELADESLFRSTFGERRAKTTEIILAGLSIWIEAAGKTYEVCSDECPASDSASFRGTMWPRSLLPLTGGMSIEQQMLLPAGGDAVAMSWRLMGRTLSPARLGVSPVFLVRDSVSATGFEIEPETNGGRLAWRPYDRSSKIIADTNGRCVQGTSSFFPSGISPASFEFDLGSRPAVLILSAELQSKANTDPLIGGFLAHLAQQPTAMTEYDHRRNLVAA